VTIILATTEFKPETTDKVNLLIQNSYHLTPIKLLFHIHKWLLFQKKTLYYDPPITYTQLISDYNSPLACAKQWINRVILKKIKEN
jgi:hypothetical protein